MTIPGFLRVVGPPAAVVGATGSVGLMIWVGHRNPSWLLLLMFVIWVGAPFAGLMLADMRSTHWSVLTRATLHGLMVILAVCSLALYADVLLRPRSQPAAMFLVVPAGSWLLIAIALTVAAQMSGKGARQSSGSRER
jgi:hypothetical protein